MTSYSMEEKYDCGPAALAFVTGQPLQIIKKLWEWRGHGDQRDNIYDTPWNSFSLLSKLKIKFQICNCSKIVQGKASNDKTIILIHNPASPILLQHWVVLHSVTPTHVLVHWGDGSIKAFPKDQFQKLYAGGTPACAYEVGIGNYKLSWYQRLYVKLTGVFT